ncbi:MAG: methylenetetrahydrofolate reductase C-terminal domain-containing protein [Dehalococcoidia bacterium]
MIVAEKKPFAQIKQMVQDRKKIMIMGCGTCVAVCMAGGEKEVELLASQMRLSNKLAGKNVEIIEATVTRQCDREYMESVLDKARECDAVISMACGVGIQLLSDLIEEIPVYPGVNTRFIGTNESEGVWLERCMMCGDCILGETGGICPIAICAKGLVNGPCGGTNKGKCEVSSEKDCAWTLIYRRLEKQGKLDNIRAIFPPKKHGLHVNPIRQTNEAYLHAEMEEAHHG